MTGISPLFNHLYKPDFITVCLAVGWMVVGGGGVVFYAMNVFKGVYFL